MVRVGLVGCGAIGTQVALALQRRYRRTARLTLLHDTDPLRAHRLQRRLAPAPRLASLPTLVRDTDLVIEAASIPAAQALLAYSLRWRRDLLLMSVGALLRKPAWLQRARRAGIRVYVPSGALGGLDLVKALSIGRLRRVTLTSRKPPGALAASPYVRRHGWRLDRLRRPRVLLDGAPRQVVEAFPHNTNVAAALVLAAGTSRARVRVIADPTLRTNRHEVEVVGDAGRFQGRIESRPSANPKTSMLAIQSAIATLDRIFDPINIGT